MKKKLLVIAIALFSSSTFSATGNGYKIIDSKIYASPGSNFHVEEVPPGTAAALKKSLLGGATQTTVPESYGQVNKPITVNGYHDFVIMNITNQTQLYTLTLKLDCQNLHSYYVTHVQLTPQGTYEGSFHTYGAVQEGSPGNYRISAQSDLAGESNHSSSAYNTLHVNK